MGADVVGGQLSIAIELVAYTRIDLIGRRKRLPHAKPMRVSVDNVRDQDTADILEGARGPRRIVRADQDRVAAALANLQLIESNLAFGVATATRTGDKGDKNEEFRGSKKRVATMVLLTPARYESYADVLNICIGSDLENVDGAVDRIRTAPVHRMP